MDALFARPGGPALSLRRRPVPGTWDTADGAHRRELTGYLDELEHDLDRSARPGGHLALELRVGLPRGVHLDRDGHDLDDYLLPIVSRLGAVRFDAVFATKEHAEASSLRIAPALRGDRRPEPPQVRARVVEPATTIAWKEQLHAACRRATPLPAPAGPVAVQIRLGVSRRRDWSALWKPAVDALGPILDVADPATPYRSRDDRITSLALHRRLDDTVGHRVDVEVWWQPAGTSSRHEGAGLRTV